eukprot:1312570-Prymnesium_polylepis.1
MEPTSPSASAAHPPGEKSCMMPPSGASLRSGGSLTSDPSGSRSAGSALSDPASPMGTAGAVDVNET